MSAPSVRSATPSIRAISRWPRALPGMALLLVSCRTHPPPGPLPLPVEIRVETRAPARRVIDPSDGCSREEAVFFARRCYDLQFGPGVEGGMVAGGETETHWVFKVITGYAAVHTGDILVSKTTGAARYERH
ncbi:MAG: hypothetical protein U1F87_09840 [Kiritimatiellia bacterium]